QRVDVQEASLALEFLDLHGDLVGYLGAQLAHDLLAHQLGGQEAAGAVGDLVLREEVLVLRQAAVDQVFQGVQVLRVQSGDGNQLGVGQLFGQPLQVGQQLG